MPFQLLLNGISLILQPHGSRLHSSNIPPGHHEQPAFLPLQHGHQPSGSPVRGWHSLAIDCIAIEDEYGNTPAQRAELDWLLYNKPLGMPSLMLGGGDGPYLSLGCGHGRLEDQ